MDENGPSAAAKLIEARRKQRGLSARSSATKAMLSEGRWRQIAKGHVKTRGIVVPVEAPDDTLARMAVAVGVTSSELTAIGEKGIAELVGQVEAGRLRHPARRTDEGDPGSAVSLIPDDMLIAELGRRLVDRESTIREFIADRHGAPDDPPAGPEKGQGTTMPRRRAGRTQSQESQRP